MINKPRTLEIQYLIMLGLAIAALPVVLMMLLCSVN